MSGYFVLEHVSLLSSRNISVRNHYVPDTIEELDRLIIDYLGRDYNRDGYSYGFLILFMGSGQIGYIDLSTVIGDIRNKKIEICLE